VRIAFASRAKWLGPLAGAAALSVGLGLGAVAIGAASGSPSAPQHANAASSNSAFEHGGKSDVAGKIKHVWLIILENKSYDATFTGLNNNTYLWKTLPSQGALLKQYYGTSHFSLGNYTSMVSGQAAQPDLQSDCPYYDSMGGTIDTSGSLATNPNYGQILSAAGANAKVGTNGCVYPKSVPTLFNQFDSAGVSWKGYAQDLNTSTTPLNLPPGTNPHSVSENVCGSPFATPGATGSTTQANPGSAGPIDQYVPKHFPFPWFDSVLQSGDCNAKHIANVFDPTNGLYHDLQNASTTPAFSWISPNNCSDAHDAVCHGNNLSGGFSDPNTAKAPVNYTGGLYASDLFLQHIVPEIEASPAFKQGGLIDITFDEGFPPFTYTGNSFNNSTKVQPNAAASIASDSAAETLYGKTVRTEPTGPNTPLATDPQTGYQLYPGPGYNAFIDRPGNCVAQTVPSQPASKCITGGAGAIPGARTDGGATAPSGASQITDNSTVATDVGRSVTGAGIPAGAFVGQVLNGPTTATSPAPAGFAVTGAFTIVDNTGNPLTTTGPVSGVILGARTAQTDPLFDATHATTGGGDTGSVLISPFIRPGTVSKLAYNHYSWLRTMEDLFRVKSTSPGLDGRGHIGYAAQPGLAGFGADVFTSPWGPWGHHARSHRTHR
jgi:hypothetical protein